MPSRNTQKSKFGICLECACNDDRIDEGYTWCLKCEKQIQDSHISKMVKN